MNSLIACEGTSTPAYWHIGHGDRGDAFLLMISFLMLIESAVQVSALRNDIKDFARVSELIKLVDESLALWR